MEKLRIILADDHPLVRIGFEEMLSQLSPHKLIKIYKDGYSLWDFIDSLDCDVLVLDIDLPGKNGLEILERIKKVNPRIRVLMMSIFHEEQYAMKAFKLGADGYIQKDAEFETIIKAIETIASGDKYISPNLAKKIAIDYIQSSNTNYIQKLLSEREYQIFLLLAHGKLNQEIADELFLSAKTVSTHKKNIFEKLKINNLVELIELAQKYGII